MKNFSVLSLTFAFLLTSCATTDSRSPASENGPSETSVQLAKKLNGGNVRFVSQSKDGGDSLLQYLQVDFRDCKAELGDRALSNGRSIGPAEDYVVCDTDFHVGPFKGKVNAKIWGGKKQFSMRFVDQKGGRHDLEIEAMLTWDSDQKKWTGSGFVNGWYNSKGLTVTIRENIKL